MSKPMTLSKPAFRAVSTAATTPPAGPERIASLPWKRSAAVKPPEDCMNMRRGRETLRTGVLAAVGVLGRGAAQLVRHLHDVAAEERRKIGVDDRGVAAADELDQRRDLVARRDLRESHAAGQCCDLPFVLGPCPGMHEDDRHRADAGFPRRLEVGAHRGEVGRRLDGAVGAHALAPLRPRSRRASTA